MAMNWSFLMLMGFAGLCFLALAIGAMILVIRAALRSSGRPPGGSPSSGFVPPIPVDDSLTNPAHPLYHLHHPGAVADDATRQAHFSASHSAPTFDASPAPSASFDGGGASSCASPGCDGGGSNCG